ncbi:hypothetical protein M3Y99_00543300 [Aphelenchoides fujianensis]|nr:hypothetical protein M3Y99_00543300 [Aphelenchoides fujianensis]
MRVLVAVFFILTAVSRTSAEGDRPLASSNSFLPSVAVYTSVLKDTFHCMSEAGIKVVFVRVYEPRNGGQVDRDGVQNAHTIYYMTDELYFEYFFHPAPRSSKTGAQQFHEAFDYMQAQAPLLSMYCASPIDWSASTYTNTNPSTIAVGIYTNWYDWEQITGSTSALSSNVLLWYWYVCSAFVDSALRNTNGFGNKSESSPDFDDFFPFGNFRSAAAKTYGIGETMCSGTPVHRNIYWRSWLDGRES